MPRTVAARAAFSLAFFAMFFTQLPPQAFSAGPDDFAVNNGWFYSQTNGKPGGGESGFTVSNADGIPFWDWFNTFGGVTAVGYPVSHRFQWNGFTVQAFQKVVFQWRPEAKAVFFVNVFDELSSAGKDGWLGIAKQVPGPADWKVDTGKPWPEIVRNHQALLEKNPDIKSAYLGMPDPVTSHGLPMSVEEYPNVVVLRAQRKVFQQWKIQVPWAAAGQVVVANGGDVGKEAGIYPAGAIVPLGPGVLPPQLAVTPVVSSSATPAPAVTPSPTATPSATRTANAAGTTAAPTVQGKNPLLGVWDDAVVDDASLTKAAESGAAWVRTVVSWEQIEPSQAAPPAFSWDKYDRQLKLISDRGLRPIVTIAGAPKWAAEPACGPFKPGGQDRFVQFVKALVQRYSAAPYSVKTWMFYEEPDAPADRADPGTPGCWGKDPAGYGAMLRAVYPAIKAIDAEAKVSTGSLAADWFDDQGGVYPRSFLKDVMDPAKGNAGGSVDIVAFNYAYVFRRNWEKFGTGILGKAQGIREQLSAFGLKKPLLVGKVGMLTEGGSGKTSEDMAVYLAQTLTALQAERARNGDGVQIGIWNGLRGNPQPDWGNGNFGLLAPDGSPKAAYKVLQNWIRELGGATLLKNESEPSYDENATARRCEPDKPFLCDSVEKLTFSVEEGVREKWVVWLDPGRTDNKTYSLRKFAVPANRYLSAFDKYGQQVIIQREGDSVTVPVTESPLFILLKK